MPAEIVPKRANLYNPFQPHGRPILGLAGGILYNRYRTLTPGDKMKLYAQRIIDRQVGRNAQLFAESVSSLQSPEGRYPYLRILISIIEQAHPEWGQAPEKDRHIAQLVSSLSGARITEDEVADVVRVRDEERGYFYD